MDSVARVAGEGRGNPNTGDQLDWLDGADVSETWDRLRARVTSNPRLRGDLAWTAGLWINAEEDCLVLLAGNC